MKTTIIPAIKNAAFHAPFLLGGGILANQVYKWAGEDLAGVEKAVSDGLAKAPFISEELAGGTVHFLEFALGSIMALSAAHAIKRFRKRRDFRKHLAGRSKAPDPAEATAVTQPGVPMKVLGIVGKLIARSAFAMVAAGLLLASGWIFPSFYAYFREHFLTLMNENAGAVAGVVDKVPGRIVLAVMLIEASSFLYSLLVARKHGPIFKRYYIDGWIGATRWIHPLSLKIRRSRLIANVELKEVRGMHSQIEPCATIKIHDYRTKRKQKMIIAYRKDLEPHKMERTLSPRDILAVTDYIREHRQALDNAGGVAPSEIAEVALECKLYKAAEDGYFKERGTDLISFDIVRIVKAMAGSGEEDLLTLDSERLAKRLNLERLYDIGGHFQAAVFTGSPLSVRVTMRENLAASVSASSDPKAGYGVDYADKRKMLMVLQFRCYESSAPADDTAYLEHADEVASGAAQHTNIVREDRKAWNQLIPHGFGKSYIIYMGGSTYIYDEWWFGSGKFITDLIPGLRGREFAPRRIGYIHDGVGDKILAKITDDPWRVPTKIFGNFDRIIDVYDEDLARNDNFGLVLCLFSRFLDRQRVYRDNRIQETPAIVAQGADADSIQQV